MSSTVFNWVSQIVNIVLSFKSGRESKKGDYKKERILNSFENMSGSAALDKLLSAEICTLLF